MTNVRYLGVAGLLALTASLAFADDLAKSFEEASARGDAQQNEASTREYFTNVLMPYYGRKYAPVLQSCFASVSKPDNSSFSFVAAIGADGRIVRLYRDRETSIFLCMRTTLEKDVFPPPPESPYYLHIEMSFTDRDAPRGGSQKDAPPLVLEPNKYSYTFGVPEGWEFSFEEAQRFGAHLVFFPKGGSFDKSNSVIYVTEPCTANCEAALSRTIAQTLLAAKDDSPTLQVANGSPIRINDGGEAQVRMLTAARDPRRAKEALAFIEHAEAIVLVVLTTKDTKTWEQDYRAFQKVVSGHKFFTCGTPGLATPCRQQTGH